MDGARLRAGADAGLLVLLHLGGGQRDRDHGAQSGLRHDDADDHHLVGGAAAVRPLGHDRHVLRDGDRGHGLHGAVGVGPDHHRPEDRLLAGLDAGGAGAGEVPRRRSAAAAAGLTIVMLAQAFQFGEAAPGDPRPVLAAPQASIMKALVEGFMSHQPVAYLLFGAGAMMALVMEMLGMSALIFALGMYLPLELNTPALVGGILSHFVSKRAERPAAKPGKQIRERGIIIASGLMAGGALGGVFGAALRLIPGFRED